MIALSFDVEPDFPPYFDSNKGIAGLKKVCDILHKSKSDATFFLCADFLEKNPVILDYMKGFEIACHGLRHVDLRNLGDLQLEGEILEAVEIFEEFNLAPRGFRAPYAGVDLRVLKVISKYFEYDSSLLFYQKKPKNVDIKEIPFYTGGKAFGIKPSLFKKTLSFPLENKVYFIHPWEFGGFDFKLVENRRKKMKILGYKQDNYMKNLEIVLKEKPVRVSELV
jgi:peptidoglycan/xylan/chitin deacetylase (PgdA/CDA1 family)